MTDEPKAPTVAREQRRKELAEVDFSKGQQGGALMQPANGRELMDMANMMSASGQMIRDFYRGNPGDCAALIMICQPYGFNPFMVSWKTYKASKNADAPISFEGQLVNAMVNMSAPVRGRLRYEYTGTNEDGSRKCIVTGVDRETGEAITYESPPIKAIPTKNSPLWKADPDQQLGYYSARAWARRHFPELLLGIYTREEIEEAPIRDVTPQPGKFAEMARKAREASQEAPVAEAEVLPPEEAEARSGETFGHWTEALDVDDGFPGSDAFTEGVKAYAAALRYIHNPYEDDRSLATDWAAGWVMAERSKRGQE
jgi:hypothetical protein